MPRQPRIAIPETVYHVFTRGHNKMNLFLDDEDRAMFLKYLKRAQDRHPWDCLGFCLMTNHYHLQVKTHDKPIGQTMHLLNTMYAGHFNYRYKNVGHVFQNRFHSIPVQTDQYLLQLSRYIHLNPVVAGMVGRPEDHRWSSYRDYIGAGSSGLVKPDLILDILSQSAGSPRQLYRQFVLDGLHKKPEFDDATLWKTRILGNDSFIRWIVRQCPAAFAKRNLKDELLIAT